MMKTLEQCCEPVFDAVVGILQNTLQDEAALLRKHMIKVLASFEASATQAGHDSASIGAAKLALVALIDETVMQEQSDRKVEWSRQLLQVKYFSHHLAGETFYDNLRELQQAPYQHIDVITVYYLCLGLGFHGKYVNDVDKVKSIKYSLERQISTISQLKSDGNYHISQASQATLTSKLMRLPWWAMLGVTAGILLSIYLGYSFAIDITSHHLQQKLHHVRQY
ncbi:MAG: hypothetical protein CMF50_10540 [Legionellales bacterium]|nr:hypothetical protein [Legionellales bacterium]|tara:strand:- start:13957 stop:14625 length:669 start_codon:yes stop_codon:yes gene_type:complete